MNYLTSSRKFISSYNIYEGLYAAGGILVPIFFCFLLHKTPLVIPILFGVIAGVMIDGPGPIQHRRNGFLVGAVLLLIVLPIGGLTMAYPILFGIVLMVITFFFALLSVYGAKASSISFALLIIFVLQLHSTLNGWDILWTTLYILLGFVWFASFKLIAYSVRPYKMLQQLMGAYVATAAKYVRLHTNFYYQRVQYDDKNISLLLQRQSDIELQEKAVASMLFNTTSITKETTHRGRVLMMIFLEVNDLLERMMFSYVDFKKMRKDFEQTQLLSQCGKVLLLLSRQLDNIAIALQNGNKSVYDARIESNIKILRVYLDELRTTIMNEQTIGSFIKITMYIKTFEEIASRIYTLHQYTTYDIDLSNKIIDTPSPSNFITRTSLSPKLLWHNLTLSSNVFRHALRLSTAVTFAYVLGMLLPKFGVFVGRPYWIILTVVVILKPEYGLSKIRNIHRIGGTVLGALIAYIFLYIVHAQVAIIWGALIVSMVLAYSFMRLNYFIFCTLLTIYLFVGYFLLLPPIEFTALIENRLIDTGIGSALAILFSLLFSPVWEYKYSDRYLIQAISDSLLYFQTVAKVFAGTTEYNKQIVNAVRKKCWVAQTNLSNAFNRMMTEPKRKQKNKERLHQLIVANHMLSSHVATLAGMLPSLNKEYIMDEYQPLILASTTYMQEAVRIIENNNSIEHIEIHDEKINIDRLENKVNDLLNKRNIEITKGELETVTKIKLIHIKSIADHFYTIYQTTSNILKLAKRMETNPVSKNS